MRTLLLLTFAGLTMAATPPAARAQDGQDPDMKAAGGGALPAGWEARLDQAESSLADLHFRTMGSGFHATMGPAAIFYDPARTATGEYEARATFTQTKAPRHPEAYGLFIGGRNLDAANQNYLYFLVRQDGQFLIKHRAGSATHTLVDWTEHSAVQKADAAGKATNALAVDVGAESLRFLVNGTEVATLDRGGMVNPDGIVGLRVNHNLDVHIAGFAVEPAGAGR